MLRVYPVQNIKEKLSIENKLEICHRHEMGQSYISLSKKYGLGKSPIHDIIQSEDRVTEYAMEIQHASGSKREDPSMTSCLHLWFLQKRAMDGTARRKYSPTSDAFPEAKK